MQHFFLGFLKSLNAGTIPVALGVYHLQGKSGWIGKLIMVQDFPAAVFRQARVSLS